MSYRNKNLKPDLYNYTVESDTLTAAALDPCFFPENFAFFPSDSSTVDKTVDFILKSTYSYVSKEIRRPIFNKTYKAFADYFFRNSFVIKTTEVSSIDSFKYYDNDILVDVDPTTYYTGSQRYWTYIDLKDQEYWPDTYDKRKGAIELEYTAGYGSKESDIPDDLRHAVYMIALKWLENRGDCTDLTATNEGLKFSIQASIPHAAKLILAHYKVPLTSRGPSYASVTQNISLHRGNDF